MYQQGYEYAALALLSQPPFHHPGIRVPATYHFLKHHWLLLLEDLGPLPSVKSYLAPGLSTSQASTIGTILGSYLANIHNNTSTNNATILSQFSGNETARTLSSSFYFTQLPAIAAEHGYSGPHIQTAADQAIHDINHGNEVLTLGDFWTGNVLIDPEALELYVIDLELAKPGTADFDIGQMAAEMYFVAAFRDHTLGMAALRAYFQAYRAQRQEKVDVAKVAIRIAAHIFVIGTRYWQADADAQNFKKQLVVADELLRLGVARDENALRDTIVGSLIS